MMYAEAGVDIDKANRIVRRIKPFIAGGNTGFAHVGPHFGNYPLVTSTDGVGTKSTLVMDINYAIAPTVLSQDLLGMVFNDIATTGASPVSFMDYIAMHELDEEFIVRFVERLSELCKEMGANLVGGETAEMPNHYADNRKIDLVGFGVGALQSKKLDGSRIQIGDLLVGIPSSGPHSNGYSLINKLVYRGLLPVVGGLDAIETSIELMRPTRLYTLVLDKMGQHLVDEYDLPLDPAQVIRAAAHITGGGLIDNVPRMFKDDNLAALLHHVMLKDLRLPIFDKIQEAGKIGEGEMYRTFNMGIGFVLCVNPKYIEAVMESFEDTGSPAYVIGRVVDRIADRGQIFME